MARILFFGRLRDVAGCTALELEQCGADLGALRDLLARDNAALGAALRDQSVRVAVNHEMVAHDASLEGAREIAFLPPLSGG